MIFAKLLKALKVGNSLADPTKWKKGQWLTNAVGTFVMACIGIFQWKFPEVAIPTELADLITGGIVSILAIINLYAIPATTRKIGTKNNEDAISTDSIDTGSY